MDNTLLVQIGHRGRNFAGNSENLRGRRSNPKKLSFFFINLSKLSEYIFTGPKKSQLARFKQYQNIFFLKKSQLARFKQHRNIYSRELRKKKKYLFNHSKSVTPVIYSQNTYCASIMLPPWTATRTGWESAIRCWTSWRKLRVLITERTEITWQK